MTIPRGIKKLIDFGIDFYRFWLRFGTQLGGMLATLSGPRRPKRPPRRFQDVSKTVLKGIFALLKIDFDFELCWDRFWLHLGVPKCLPLGTLLATKIDEKNN